jgi:hypothetical protein
VPLRPSISTTQSRHEPKEFKLSEAQSLGIVVSSILAARITEVPAGTVIACPSMVTVTFSVELLAGVPKSVL